MKIFILFLLLLSLLDLFNCEIEDDIPVLDYKDSIEFILDSNQTTEFYFKMYIDKIESEKICFYVYKTAPTNYEFDYKLEKGSPTDYTKLDGFMVSHKGDSYTYGYKIEKPEDKNNTFYGKITASGFNKGQTIIIESTDSVTDILFIIYLITGLIVGLIEVASIVLVIFVFYTVYSVKRDKSITESNADVIIAKLGPDDYS